MDPYVDPSSLPENNPYVDPPSLSLPPPPAPPSIIGHFTSKYDKHFMSRCFGGDVPVIVPYDKIEPSMYDSTRDMNNPICITTIISPESFENYFKNELFDFQEFADAIIRSFFISNGVIYRYSLETYAHTLSEPYDSTTIYSYITTFINFSLEVFKKKDINMYNFYLSTFEYCVQSKALLNPTRIIKNLIKLITFDPSHLDKFENMLHFRNVSIDLNTYEAYHRQSFSRVLFVTKIIDYDFLPIMESQYVGQQIYNFLLEIIPDTNDLDLLICKIIAPIFPTDHKYKKAFKQMNHFFGNGGDGKSTIFTIIRLIFPSLYQNFSSDTLTTQYRFEKAFAGALPSTKYYLMEEPENNTSALNGLKQVYDGSVTTPIYRKQGNQTIKLLGILFLASNYLLKLSYDAIQASDRRFDLLFFPNKFIRDFDGNQKFVTRTCYPQIIGIDLFSNRFQLQNGEFINNSTLIKNYIVQYFLEFIKNNFDTVIDRVNKKLSSPTSNQISYKNILDFKHFYDMMFVRDNGYESIDPNDIFKLLKICRPTSDIQIKELLKLIEDNKLSIALMYSKPTKNSRMTPVFRGSKLSDLAKLLLQFPESDPFVFEYFFLNNTSYDVLLNKAQEILGRKMDVVRPPFN